MKRAHPLHLSPSLLIVLVTLLGSLLITPAMLAQGLSRPDATGWRKQAPIPTPYSVHELVVLSQTEVWGASAPFAGDGNFLVHTTDGGKSWESRSIGRALAVHFVDSRHGWAAGNGFWHTTDGGESWVKDNDWGSIYDIFFLDTQRGWACGNGGVAYSTTDGGRTWSFVATGADTTLSSIQFVSPNEGWTTSIGGGIYHSVDGGASWTLQHDVGESHPNLQSARFFDASHGWVVGGRTFLKTQDGGRTWTRTPVPPGTWAYAADFFDMDTGIAVGEYGNIVRTTDGETWSTVQPVGSGMRLWTVQFASPNVAYYGGDSGTLSRSTDGGRSWSTVQSGATGITRGLDFLNRRVAWVANQGGEIARTTNGGRLWERVAVSGFDIYGDLHDVDFADSQHGWVVGQNQVFGAPDDGRIARSVDGGETWSLQLNLPATELLGVTAIDDRTALAYGRAQVVESTCLRTTDGGATWRGVLGLGGTTQGFRDAFFLTGTRTGWLVGIDIFHSTDGGASWTHQASGNGAMLSSLSFCDPLNGWAVGYAKQILHTTDGGASWNRQTAPAPPGTAFTGVTAISPSTAWLAGWDGFVARTTDGGRTWTQEDVPGAGSSDFELAVFLDAETGWVAGTAGIFKRNGLRAR